MRERTLAEELIQELAARAADSVILRSIYPSAPGAMIQHLSSEERTVLQGLTSEDVATPRVDRICHLNRVALAQDWYRRSAARKKRD